MDFLIGIFSFIIVIIFLAAMAFGFREEMLKNHKLKEKVSDELLEDLLARLAPMLTRQLESPVRESEGRDVRKAKDSLNQSNIYDLTKIISERKNVRNRQSQYDRFPSKEYNS